MVAVLGITSVLMAYVEGIGFGTMLGLDGNTIIDILPFILLGIGVDDMFLLLFCLDQAPV